MPKKIPESEWDWFGYAGHLCVSKRCAFHLTTAIGDRIVSTVGAFYPDRDSEMETIGAGDDAFFETFVFEYHGRDENRDPIKGEHVDGTRYADSRLAEMGHMDSCERVASEGATPTPTGEEADDG